MPYKDKDGHTLYKGVCDVCGFERIARYYDLKTTSKCTHLGIDGKLRAQSGNTNWHNKRIQNIFKGMKSRCYNVNDKSYKWYGAKGINIYDEWLDNPSSFEEWSLANGYNDEMTIDRIHADKDYCPENCRWTTSEINCRNKHTTSFITIGDKTYTGRELALNLGLGLNTINRYLRKYGVDNTVDFIKRYTENPDLKRNNRNQSFYDLYMDE